MLSQKGVAQSLVFQRKHYNEGLVGLATNTVVPVMLTYTNPTSQIFKFN